MAPKLPVTKIDPKDVPDLPGKSAIQILEPMNQNLDVLARGLDAGLTLKNLKAIQKTVQVSGPDEWVPLVLGTNWVAVTGSDTAPPSYRYAVDGLTVETRGFVTWTGGGTPPAGSPIATNLPTPAFRDWHAVVASNAFGRVDTVVTGQLWYMAGVTTVVSLRGVIYEPAVPSLPAWVKPLDVVLGEVNLPPVGRPDAVFLTAVERDDKGIAGPVSIEGWQAGPISADERSTVRFRRVNGLAAGVKYRLSFVFLMPD